MQHLFTRKYVQFYLSQAYLTFFKWFLSPLFLVATTIITYYPSLNFPFQFDDGPTIVKYYYLRNLTFSSLFFKSTRWISFWINSMNYKVVQFDPFLYRSLNVFFHVLTSCTIFYVLMLLLSRSRRAFFHDNSFTIAILTMMLFLLHPVQTQTVSYVIQGQLEGLAALFIMAIALMFILATTARNIFIKTILYGCMFFIAFLSTGTKEVAIVSPWLIMLLDWFFIAQGDWQLFKKRLPIRLALGTLVVGIYIYLMKPSFFYTMLGMQYTLNNNIGNLLTENAHGSITPYLFFISQFKVIIHYIWMFMWPFSISVDYDWKLCTSFINMDCIVPFFIICSLLFASCMVWIKDKTNGIIFGIAWFFICLAPRSTIVPSTELMADYKTYLASFGLLFIAAILITYYLNKFSSRISKGVFLGCCIIGLATATYSRNLIWSTGLNFWGNIIKHAPEKARGYNNYAIELINLHKFKDAIPYLKKAIQLEPATYPDPYTNLANVYAILGNFDLAIDTIRKSISMYPYLPDTYNSLGVFLLEKNDIDNAKRSFYASISLLPHFGKPYYNLGRAFRAEKDLENALKFFKFACTKTDLDNDPLPYEPYAEIAIELKRYDEAIFALKKLYTLTKNPKHLSNIGVAYYHLENYVQAQQFFEQVRKLNPYDIRTMSNLMECYIKTGQVKLASDLMNSIHNQEIYYPGLEIHEAQAYVLGEHVAMAKKILQQYLTKKIPDDLRKKAQALLNDIRAIDS